MDKKELLDLLCEVLQSIDYHEAFPRDLLDVFGKSGEEASFLASFSTRLKELSLLKHNAVIQKPDTFEKLSNGKGFYSMHVNTKNINYRILYTSINGRYVLLHGFFERKGKRRTGYGVATAIAEKRRKELEE